MCWILFLYRLTLSLWGTNMRQIQQLCLHAVSLLIQSVQWTFFSMYLKLDLWILTGKIISAHLPDINSDLQFTARNFKGRKPQSLVDALILHHGVLPYCFPLSCCGYCVVLEVCIWLAGFFEELQLSVGRWGCSSLARSTHFGITVETHVTSAVQYVCTIYCESHIH